MTKSLNSNEEILEYFNKIANLLEIDWIHPNQVYCGVKTELDFREELIKALLKIYLHIPITNTEYEELKILLNVWNNKYGNKSK